MYKGTVDVTGMLHEFRGKRILVVEEGDYLCDYLRGQLTPHGATVLGPMPSVGASIALVEIGRIDAAILDIKLDAETAFFLAQALLEQEVPFIFVTPAGAGRRYQGYELGAPSFLPDIGRALFGSRSH